MSADWITFRACGDRPWGVRVRPDGRVDIEGLAKGRWPVTAVRGEWTGARIDGVRVAPGHAQCFADAPVDELVAAATAAVLAARGEAP